MEYDTENGICVLTISLLLAEDIGEYRCTAVNVHGQASTAASILYKDQYDDWLADEQMKITREKKRNVLEELDNVVQQPRKQKGTFYTPQSQRMLNMLYSKDNGVPEERQAAQGYNVSELQEEPLNGQGEAPQVVRPLRPVSVQEGQDAELSCQIKGNPTPKVRWFKNSTPLTSSQRISTTARGITHSLFIRMVLPEDAAKYSLMAENRFGKLEQVTNLIIIEKRGQNNNHQNSMATAAQRTTYAQQREAPSTPAKPLQYFGDDGVPKIVGMSTDKLSLARGQPAQVEIRYTPENAQNFKFAWFKDNRPLVQSARIVFRLLPGRVRMDIAPVKVEDSGLYRCIISGPKGDAEARLTISVEDNFHAIEQDGSFEEYVADTETEVLEQPHFVTQLNGARAKEGDRVCLQAKVAPKHDSSLTVDWLKDGRPLKHANRIKMLFEFGYVSLSFNPVYREDNGTYTCVIRNRAGTSTSSASILCESDEDIVSKTQHGDAVDSIKRIDNREVRVGPLEEERPEELMSLKAPHFVWNLTNAEVAEGQSVRFQGRVMPSNDPKLNVEWYFNRKPLLSGHRFRPAFDFGYVFLDILYAYPEDSGLYSIVARNQLGECVSEAQLTVKSKKTIYSESQHPDRLDRIEQLESVVPTAGEQEQEQGSTQLPVLRNQLRDMVLQEGGNLHLDLRVEPKNDPHMTVDWFLNGHPVLTGSRTHFTFDFGYVALDVKQLIAEDSGQYTVVIRNDRGEVSSTCNVQIETKATVLTEVQHVESFERIRALESSDKRSRPETEDEVQKSAPVFVRPLSPSNSTLMENSRLHLECEVAPKQDSTMTVQWFKNGMPIPTGHRFKPFYDFGFASLDVIGVYPEDSGTYTCVLTNSLGSASSDATFVCEGVSSVQLATQHPQSYDQILILEAPKQKAVDQEELPAAAPQFVEKLSDQVQADEGQSVQLQCQVTPKDDPNLSVTWYFNGQPLKFSHRFRHSKDFGYIVLNILYVYPEDSGDYACVVRNGSGSAQSQCHLTCGSKKSMLTETCHPDSLKRIIELETPAPKPEGVEEQFTEPPKFMGDFSGAPKLLNEGDTFQIDCPVEPANDPNMVVEWFFNGKPLVASHRFRPMYQMGFASLEIVDVYPEDSGLYTCRARNLNGQAEISAPLQCQGGEQILTEPNQPDSWKLIKEMEEKQELPVEEEIVETAPPCFVQPLAGELTVQEGQPVSFSCQFAPANDPTTSVEWYFNNTPLKQGSRLRHINDFGCVLLEIASVIPTDSGIYTCVARNKNGLDKTSIGLLCLRNTFFHCLTISISYVYTLVATGSLYLESQHEESWKKIKAFEEAQPERASSPEVKFAAPNFTQVLQNVDNLAEGSSVRLQCRLEPLFDPTMKIAWFKNGEPLPQGTRFRTLHDFDYVALDILTLNSADSGIYQCKATSASGEVVTSCSLKCERLNHRIY
ncbi:hypothetical protein D918_01776 [Trichuris suis]|nr:hypothetical protein D918_01776 [Trichuris suis]